MSIAGFLLSVSVALAGPPAQSADEQWLASLGTARPEQARQILSQGSADDLKNRLSRALATIDPFWERPTPLPVLQGLVLLADQFGSDTQKAQARLPLACALEGAKRYDDGASAAAQAISFAERGGDQYVLGEAWMRRGNLLSEKEQRIDALAAFGKAAEVFPHTGPHVWRLGVAWGGMGEMLHELKRYDEAVHIFERAGDLNEGPPSLCAQYYAQVINIAIERRDGDLERFAIGKTLPLYEAAGEWRLAARNWLGLSYLAGDRYYEAWNALENARDCWMRERDPDTEAAWCINSCFVLSHLDRFEEELGLLEKAERYYNKVGDKHGMAVCLLDTGNVLSVLGFKAQAYAKLTRAEELYRESGNLVQAGGTEVNVAEMKADEGRFEEAIQLARHAATEGDVSIQGMAAAVESAANDLHRYSLAESLALRGEQLFAEIHSPGASGCLAIRSRTEAAQQRFKEASDLAEQALQVIEQWRKSLVTPEFAAAAKDGPGRLAGLGANLLVSQGRTEDAFRFVQRAKSASSTVPENLNSDHVAARLNHGEVILEFAVADEYVVAYLIQPRAKPAILTHRRLWNYREVGRAVDQFSAAVRGGDEGRAKALGRALYARLLGPFEKEIRSAQTIIICPDEKLHELPFAALPTPDGRSLTDDYRLDIAPSATAWVHALDRASALDKNPAGKPLVVAISKFSLGKGDSSVRGGLHDLPHALDEAAVVKHDIGSRTQILAGKAANRRTFLHAVTDAGLLHVATHAICNTVDPNQTALVLSPENKADSGVVYPRDLLAAKLKCRLAVLSACGTYQGRLSSGEGLHNFAWAFVVAGCPCVISTRWKIDDRAALAWAKAFYASYAKNRNPSASYQTACLALKRSKEYSSPTDWAAWTLTGSNR